MGKINISILGGSGPGRLFRCKRIGVRERLLTRLLGEKQNLVILVPEGNVQTVSITEASGGNEDE